MRTPIAAAELAGERADETPRRIARLCQIYAAFLVVVCFCAPAGTSRLGLGSCAGFLLSVSLALTWFARRR